MPWDGLVEESRKASKSSEVGASKEGNKQTSNDTLSMPSRVAMQRP